MILYPAIDIMDGHAVRLVQGRFEDATRYADDPLEAAHGWVETGARYLHVVDLDGARAGEPRALEHLRRIAAGTGVPLLGICLGMQLLFERSHEHEGADGLGLLGGEVTALRGPRLPHIGWNEVAFERDSPLTAGLGGAAAFYHVHSFVCRPSDEEDVAGRGDYGERFASIVARDNVMGVQFHPEKSSRDGLALLRNFARLGMGSHLPAPTPAA